MPDANFESSQFLPKETEETVTQPNPNASKADEHGVSKTSSGQTEAADSTKANPKPVTPANPTSQGKTNMPILTTPKSTTTNKEIAATEFSSETDNVMGVTVFVKRNDGITLQFPLSFIEKQDLYNTKNMFDLIGKCLIVDAKELDEKYPAFVKG